MPALPDQPSNAARRRRPVPFVGRLAEFALVLTEAEARRSTLLTGPAGVGKSRLAQEVALHLATRSGWSVITRHATPALQQLPLGLLADIVTETPRAPGAGEAVMEAYRSLARRFAEGPTLLLVDDAAFVDDASALVLQRLMENGIGPVLLTCRSAQPLPGPLFALQRSDAFGTVELHPLGGHDARQLAVAAGAAASDAQLDDLCARAGGLPLFVLALVQHRAAEAAGHDPQALTQLLPAMLGSVQPGDVEALELVALGEPIELSIIEASCRESVLERLEQAGLIEVTQDRRRRSVRVGHPLIAEAVLAPLGELRRRRLLRELAAAVGKLGGRRHDGLRVALWQLAAGDRVEADAALRAAQQAIAGGGLTVAERLIRETIGADASAEAAYLLAGICLEQGRGEEAAALCAAAPPAGDDATQTRLAVLWAVACFDYVGDVDAARQVIARFAARVPPPWRYELDYFEIAVRFYTGDVRGAVALVEEMLATPDVPRRTRTWFMLPGSLALATAGRAAEAGRHAEAIIEQAPSLAGEIVAIETHARCIQVFAALFEGAGAGHRADLLERQVAATRGGDLASAAFLSIMLGAVCLHEGDPGAAVGWLDVPLELTGGWALAARAFRAQAFALGGRLAEAEEQLAATATIAQFSFHHALNLMAAGDLALARGHPAEAAATYDEAARHGRERGQHALVAFALLRAMAAAPTDERAAALGDAANEVDGRLGVLAATLADGWLTRSATTLGRARAVADESGNAVLALHVADVEAALHQSLRPGGAAVGRARGRAERLRARLRRSFAGPAPRGATATGNAAAERAAARRPGQRHGAATVSALTARERQIVGLAAGGASDNAIAAELAISVRTVHAHLRSAYRKLGISGRGDLAGG